jgi:hypothetical protein
MAIQPSNGLSDSCHHIFLRGPGHLHRTPREAFESDHVAWVPLAKIRDLTAEGRVVGGTTLAALLLLIADAGSAT